MRRWKLTWLVLGIVFGLGGAAFAEDAKLQLNLRKRVETAPGSGRYHALTTPVQWDAKKTAIVVCDMWNDHYCRNAARRVAEMAPHMNKVISAAREQGVLIIHCPSGCMDKYADTPQRRLAQQAPKVETKIPLQSWCHLDGERESKLPIDDSKPCEDKQPRPAVRFFTHQIKTLEIKPGDAITDSAEAFYLMEQRGVENLIVMGVHTNMCVLGRPFSIRQMKYQGKNVVLMRDMTDSMYDPSMAPYVSHFNGTELVVEHIERHWCPTITSADILGGKPFRFPRDKRPRLAIVMAEDEYGTADTLPAFALQQLGRDFQLTLIHASATDRNQIPGVEALEEADVALLSIRRRTPSTSQLEVIRRFVAGGKPIVAIRTSSHAFCLRDEKPAAGLAEWPEFDREVLGCRYANHHGNKLKTFAKPLDGVQHPILNGLEAGEFRVFSSLYKSLPLNPKATPLVMGRAETVEQQEPVAWTHVSPAGGRVFYTSLGHEKDFQLPQFQRLLRNAVFWAAGRPDAQPKATAEGC